METQDSEIETAGLFVNQAEVAGLLGVSRGTITSRQRLGLPFDGGGYKNANAYNAVACLYWDAGRVAFETRDKPVHEDPALVAAIGFLVGQGDVHQAATMLAAAFGLEQLEALVVAGQARGWWIGVDGRVPSL